MAEFAYPFRISYDDVNSLTDVVIYVNYGLHTVRILRVLRVYKYLANIEDPVQRFVYQLALSFITLLLFGMRTS